MICFYKLTCGILTDTPETQAGFILPWQFGRQSCSRKVKQLAQGQKAGGWGAGLGFNRGLLFTRPDLPSHSPVLPPKVMHWLLHTIHPLTHTYNAQHRQGISKFTPLPQLHAFTCLSPKTLFFFLLIDLRFMRSDHLSAQRSANFFQKGSHGK